MVAMARRKHPLAVVEQGLLVAMALDLLVVVVALVQHHLLLVLVLLVVAVVVLAL
jgi:hypothetical protein